MSSAMIGLQVSPDAASREGETDEQFARRLQALEHGVSIVNVRSSNAHPSGHQQHIELQPIERTVETAETVDENPAVQQQTNQLTHQNAKTLVYISIFLFWPQLIAAAVVLSEHWNDDAPCSERSRSMWKFWIVVNCIRLFCQALITLKYYGNYRELSTQPYLRYRVHQYLQFCEMFMYFWFVLGNIWAFSSSEGTPYCSGQSDSALYSLFLTMIILTYIHIFLPCLVGLLVLPLLCCCAPCIIRFLARVHGGANQTKGATAEIIEAIPIVKLTEDHFKDDSGGSVEVACSICISDFNAGDEARELPCKHYFHQQCVDEWLRVNAICPTCRANVCPEDSPVESAQGVEETQPTTSSFGNSVSATLLPSSASNYAATDMSPLRNDGASAGVGPPPTSIMGNTHEGVLYAPLSINPTGSENR